MIAPPGYLSSPDHLYGDVLPKKVYTNLRSNDSVVSSILPLLFVPQASSFGATLISRAVEALRESQRNSPAHPRGTKLLSVRQWTNTLFSGPSPSPPCPPPPPPPRALLHRRALHECSFAAGDRLTNSPVTFINLLGRGRPLAGGKVARPPLLPSFPNASLLVRPPEPRASAVTDVHETSRVRGPSRPCAGRGGS